MKLVAKKLEAKATKVAMPSTAMSLRNSSLEGNKLCGGSIRDFSEESEGGGEVLTLGLGFSFGRFLGVEDIMVSSMVATCMRHGMERSPHTTF